MHRQRRRPSREGRRNNPSLEFDGEVPRRRKVGRHLISERPSSCVIRQTWKFRPAVGDGGHIGLLSLQVTPGEPRPFEDPTARRIAPHIGDRAPHLLDLRPWQAKRDKLFEAIFEHGMRGNRKSVAHGCSAAGQRFNKFAASHCPKNSKGIPVISVMDDVAVAHSDNRDVALLEGFAGRYAAPKTRKLDDANVRVARLVFYDVGHIEKFDPAGKKVEMSGQRFATLDASGSRQSVGKFHHSVLGEHLHEGFGAWRQPLTQGFAQHGREALHGVNHGVSLRGRNVGVPPN